jgi:hypothetical protein
VSTTLPTFPLWFYIPAALLAALGLIGLYCSLFKGRHKGRLRCRKCWYDMKGGGVTLPTRCPECGTTANTLKDLQHTRRHYRAALVALLLIVPLGVVFAKLHAKKTYYFLAPKWKLVEEVRVNDAYISRYRVRNPDAIFVSERVTLRSNGKTLIDHEDQTISLSGYKHERQTLIDLNNDGVKEAVIECYSGGAHCCYRVYIVELRPDGAALVADVDAQNGALFQPPPSAGGDWTITISDPAFNYWKTNYASAPKPSVHYRLHGGALRVDLDRMGAAMPPATADAFAHESAVIAFAPGFAEPMVVLWSTTVDILFAGHEPQAWAFFDRTWRDKPGKEAFRSEFLQVLAADPFYQDLLAARAARAEGKPIPPSIVGMSGKAANAAP